MKVRTSELTGAALDWAVAKASKHTKWSLDFLYDIKSYDEFNPSTAWSQGGPIIEREIHTLIERRGVWEAECYFPKPPDRNRFCYSLKGESALVAAMRTFVASRLGPDVEIPEEFM